MRDPLPTAPLPAAAPAQPPSPLPATSGATGDPMVADAFLRRAADLDLLVSRGAQVVAGKEQDVSPGTLAYARAIAARLEASVSDRLRGVVGEDRWRINVEGHVGLTLTARIMSYLAPHPEAAFVADQVAATQELAGLLGRFAREGVRCRGINEAITRELRTVAAELEPVAAADAARARELRPVAGPTG